MFEIKETSPAKDLHHGHTVVGTVPVVLTNLNFVLVRGVLLRAPGASDLVPNTDIVFVGRRNVTADYDPGTGGLPLVPGAVMELPVDDPSQVYVVSGSPNQDVAWMGI
jgi:hypothetical protein